VLLPADRFDKLKNKENPELYAVFPFRVFGLGKPDLARETTYSTSLTLSGAWQR